jgi:Protein of unknown function (DUF2796)
MSDGIREREMRSEGWIAAVLAAHMTCAVSAEERRELGAHEHGHSTLNIAIEGETVAMELIAPGVDIVGFEHEAKSAEDNAALEEAKAKLAAPLGLFVMPSEAGCTVETTAVEIEGEAHHAQEHHDEAHDEAEEHDAGHEAEHNEFHVEYQLACAEPDELGMIRFGYFEAFPNAMEVEVNVITEKGQSSFEVERQAPTLDLVGLV